MPVNFSLSLSAMQRHDGGGHARPSLELVIVRHPSRCIVKSFHIQAIKMVATALIGSKAPAARAQCKAISTQARFVPAVVRTMPLMASRTSARAVCQVCPSLYRQSWGMAAFFDKTPRLTFSTTCTNARACSPIRAIHRATNDYICVYVCVTGYERECGCLCRGSVLVRDHGRAQGTVELTRALLTTSDRLTLVPVLSLFLSFYSRT